MKVITRQAILSLGEKDLSSVVNLTFETEKTKAFSIEFQWPVGVKYFLWREPSEKPITFICTKSNDPKELH